jgi:hypothetical protein
MTDDLEVVPNGNYAATREEREVRRCYSSMHDHTWSPRISTKN